MHDVSIPGGCGRLGRRHSYLGGNSGSTTFFFPIFFVLCSRCEGRSIALLECIVLLCISFFFIYHKVFNHPPYRYCGRAAALCWITYPVCDLCAGIGGGHAALAVLRFAVAQASQRVPPADWFPAPPHRLVITEGSKARSKNRHIT